jgi:hypothetical protein
MFKSNKIKSNLRAPRKNKVDTKGAPVFAPDSSATGLAGKCALVSRVFYVC